MRHFLYAGLAVALSCGLIGCTPSIYDLGMQLRSRDATMRDRLEDLSSLSQYDKDRLLLAAVTPCPESANARANRCAEDLPGFDPGVRDRGWTCDAPTIRTLVDAGANPTRKFWTRTGTVLRGWDQHKSTEAFYFDQPEERTMEVSAASQLRAGRCYRPQVEALLNHPKLGEHVAAGLSMSPPVYSPAQAANMERITGARKRHLQDQKQVREARRRRAEEVREAKRRAREAAAAPVLISTPQQPASPSPVSKGSGCGKPHMAYVPCPPEPKPVAPRTPKPCVGVSASGRGVCARAQ